MAESYVKSNDYLTKYLVPTGRCRSNKSGITSASAATRSAKILPKFLSEMPATDDEAFNSTNMTVFDLDTINFYTTNTNEKIPWGVFGIRGPSEFVNPRIQPPDVLIDRSKPPIAINANAGGGIVIPFELVPLRFQGWTYETDSKRGSSDKLYVFERRWNISSTASDATRGTASTRTVPVSRDFASGLLEGSSKQVVEFASGRFGSA